jgi:hypothetical protein
MGKLEGKTALSKSTIQQQEFVAKVLANQRQLTSNLKAAYDFMASCNYI